MEAGREENVVCPLLIDIRFLLILLVFWSLLASARATAAEQRLALLIGNSAYKSSPLVNSVNDVRLMEGALKEAGFTVIKAENASIREMRRLVRDFGDKLKSSGGVGLFYFAGHGVQLRGENFLVSTDSDIRNEDEVPDDSINASMILAKMQDAGNRMNLIILDACRNNPFAARSRSASSGLATMNAPSGSLVAYSTAPGSVASDGERNNGLYTEHLARAIRQPDLPVEEVFKQVRTAVRKESNNQQTPWENTALEGQFFFTVQAPTTSSPPPAIRPPPPEKIALELAMWDSVKNSQRSAELQAYLTQFPDGTFAVLARGRIDDLKAAAANVNRLPTAPPPAISLVASKTSPQESVVTTKPLPESPVVVAKTLPELAPVAAPTTQQILSSEGTIGTLILTDTMTGMKRHLEVTAQESNAEMTVYSSGDVIAKDGKVLQVRVGEAVLQLVSGALWTIPLKAGTSGKAQIQRVDVAYESNGTLTWKVVAIDEGKVRIEAEVGYKYVQSSSMSMFFNAYGKWQATYRAADPIPESFTATIRGSQPGGSNIVSSELKLHPD
jgi:predicted secreted protein